MKFELLNGDCLEVLKTLESNSVDSLVTDPPAGISFMGKEWDSDKGGREGWIKWMSEVMRECLRVMKPGAHGLVWAIPRTSHWTATALEDAGFEIRDVITHIFGRGFPKSLNIEKAGAGKQWEGWGTALKPASEHWIMIRKPIEEKNVASNVIKFGTGGINIDASRIETKNRRSPMGADGVVHRTTGNSYGEHKKSSFNLNQGRFPANLVLSHSEHCADDQCDIECAIKALDEQSGTLKSGNLDPHHKINASNNKSMSGANQTRSPRQSFGGDSGGASRFFYCAKISTSERGAGNNHPTVKPKKLMSYLCKLITPHGGVVLDPFMGSGSTGIAASADGFGFIGIEREPDYFKIAQKRING